MKPVREIFRLLDRKETDMLEGKSALAAASILVVIGAILAVIIG